MADGTAQVGHANKISPTDAPPGPLQEA
jgi:hypothetical protein